MSQIVHSISRNGKSKIHAVSLSRKSVHREFRRNRTEKVILQSILQTVLKLAIKCVKGVKSNIIFYMNDLPLHLNQQINGIFYADETTHFAGHENMILAQESLEI